ncbi:MAG: Thymidylate synthase [Alectoria sarmentosa]|nr:MAG: Thymidylate synthase [Alectoria sarmentosa]
MAIYPNASDYAQNGAPTASPIHPISIEAWTEETTQSLSAVSIVSPGGVPRTGVSLAIDLEEPSHRKQDGIAGTVRRADNASSDYRPRREPPRRDSLKRREALLKGKDGSRRRTRWENDRLLNNPWAQPPLPSDWEVHPTYPTHAVPYYLAPLWEPEIAARADAEKKKREAACKQVEAEGESAGKVPRELREKLKKAKAAKGLLKDLEEQIRLFVKNWEDRPKDVGEHELDSEDEEIVFVGRNGQMNDIPSSPKISLDESDAERDQRLVFDSLANDRGASFGRWLVHSIASYYGLRTWSITVGDPARREAGTQIGENALSHPHEEHQYLGLIRNILENGEHRPDRTGTGTLSLFAPPALRFSLSRPSPGSSSNPIPVLPLLTTKRVFLRAVIAELLWFVAGSTSSLPLSKAGIKIWDGNGSREYLDSVGLSHREVGDLGPVYGFQWRHFGAEYVDAKTDYTGQGVDQLAEVIEKLKNKPYDRRIILSAWNPADLGKMALPPCHMFAQFYVSFPKAPKLTVQANGDQAGLAAHVNGNGAPRPRGVLSCQLYQRSCDMGLGVPFNIASYALLTHMLADVCDLTPGTFIHTMGDAHVYLDHVDALKIQLERLPRDFPDLNILSHHSGSIDGWKDEDFEIKGYKPHASIPMKMSV